MRHARKRTVAERKIALLHLLTSVRTVDHLTAEQLARSYGLPLPVVECELEAARLRKLP